MTINAGEDMEKQEPLFTLSGNLNWCMQYKTKVEVSPKAKQNRHMTRHNTRGTFPRDLLYHDGATYTSNIPSEVS